MSDSAHARARRFTRVTILLLSLALGAAAWPVAGTTVAPGEPARFAVGLHGPTDGFAVGDTFHGARITSVNTAVRFLAVTADDPALFSSRAILDANVRYVEEDPIFKMIEATPGKPALPSKELFAPLYAPNDPQYGSQYGPQQVRADLGWDTTLGDADAAVCIIDTGVRYTHVDLAGPRWSGGYDFVNNDADPNDDHGHGTHVAGTAAATIDNGVGVAGLGNTTLYGVKVLDSGGSGSWTAVASGITWCADNTGARTVHSMSLGGSSYSQAVADAAAYATGTKGHLLVAAAGNGACSNCVGYPAALPSVMAITCTANGEALCGFSSTGPEASLAAPGNNILSTGGIGGSCLTDSAYCSLSGTSMSTPHVSGAAALYWSYNTTITGAGLRARLENSAQDLGAPGFDNQFGCGELDVANLFAGTGTCTIPPPPPPPPNDNFTDAILIASTPYSNTQTTTFATMEAGEPAPCGSLSSSVWYRITPTENASITVVSAGSDYDTVLAAYTGPSLGSLVNVACNDDAGGGLQSVISFDAVAGTTYHIQAAGYSGATGSLSISVSSGGTSPGCAGGPANNCFADAVVIASAPYTTSQSTAGANMEAGEPAPCGLLGASVWYRFTPTTTGSITIDSFTSSYDTVLAAYTGSTIGGLTTVACNDDTNGLQSSITFLGTAGVTYQIQAGGYSSATGTLVLHLTQGGTPPPCGGGPANNCFVNATVVTTSPYTNTQGTAGAGLEPGEPRPCGGIGSTVWYRFTATHSGTASIDTFGSSYDTVLAAYTGSSLGGLTNVACNDDTGGFQSRIEFTTVAGTTYQVQAGGYSSATGSLVIHLSFPTVNPPGAPTDLVAAPGAAVGDVELAWNAPASDGGSPITAYRVYRSTVSGGPYVLAGSTNGSTLTYTDSGLSPLTTYWYVVRAENTAGEGAASNEACTKPFPWVAAVDPTCMLP